MAFRPRAGRATKGRDLPHRAAERRGRAGAARRHPGQQRGLLPRLRLPRGRSISSSRCTGASIEVAGQLIRANKIATPVTIKTFLPAELAIGDINLAQYLARLAAEATTIINAEDYGRAVYDLALRRALIGIGEDMVNVAYDATVEQTPGDADRGGREAALRSRRERPVRRRLPGLRDGAAHAPSTWPAPPTSATGTSRASPPASTTSTG